MSAIEIKHDIYWIGVNDRTTDLFEGLWPITHEGVSYNAYLINDDKKAIVDLAKAFKSDEFFEQIAQVVPLKQIDYLIINHMEPDHSGILKTLIQINPDIIMVCTKKAQKMLEAYYDITENIKIVEDGDTLSLGKIRLNFYTVPFVHWPETMVTFEETHGILFSCDAFGGYGALRGAIFDDECTDPVFYEKESLRYYVNIVAKFSVPVLKAIAKLKDLSINIIAPSHGLIWKKNPGRIVELYHEWASLTGNKGAPGVTLLYGSMYGNTEKMMNAVAQGLSHTGINVEIFDVARTHVSYILPSLWKYQGVMIGAPTYEGSLFPPVSDVLNMCAEKRIHNRDTAFFGSYGWSGGALRKLQHITEPMKWQLKDTFEFNGGPAEDDIQKGIAFGRQFGEMLLKSAT